MTELEALARLRMELCDKADRMAFATRRSLASLLMLGGSR